MILVSHLAIVAEWLEYFNELEANDFLHLSAVLTIILIVFFGRIIVQQKKISAARKNIPLVIGGWGTRGKSGTERCKAALFHAYGAEVFCKTTGCEAMFIHAPPNLEAHELYLFRPLEKVSIWEQMKVLTTASALSSHVFLYECMALNPRYVNVIQHGWMKDDISTITNAYPDHEDVQGPAGHNVASTISNFIPSHGVTFSTETQMTPILEQSAKEKGSRMHTISWLDGAMITDDILERYPYKEHPNNLALVMAMGRELGLADDFTLKEVADKLVPDLGVLRTYPAVKFCGKKVYSTNGMSANERRGCLDNWRRLGFYGHRCDERPKEWIVGVINNRADRIPRSKVFASIMVNDVGVHRFVLIGSNLKGMQGYLDAELEQYKKQWDLTKYETKEELFAVMDRDLEKAKIECRSGMDLEFKTEIMLHAADFLTEEIGALVKDPEMASILADCNRVDGNKMERSDASLGKAWQGVEGKFRSILEKHWAKSLRQVDYEDHEIVSQDEIVKFFGHYWRQAKAVRSLYAEITGAFGGDSGAGKISPEINKHYQEFLAAAFRKQLIVVEDYHATGDQVIQKIFKATPPGHEVHTIGMQNIKGTGLDFAYRWVDILKIQQWVSKLNHQSSAVREEAVRWLGTHEGYHYYDGLLAYDGLREALRSPMNQEKFFDDLLKASIENLPPKIAKAKNNMAGGQKKAEWYDGVITITESILDVFDSIRRRMKYDSILEDLINQRISHIKAAEELKEITYRQKGGWLKKSLSRKKAKAG